MKIIYADSGGIKSIPISQFPAEAWTSLLGSSLDYSGQQVLNLYESVPWLFRGVNARSDAVANLPVTFMVNGKEVIDYTPPFYLEWETFLNEIEGDLTLFGAAYYWMDIDKPLRTRKIERLTPNSIKPILSSELGLVGFERKISGKTTKFSIDEIGWIWLPNRRKELGNGTSPAYAALKASGTLTAVDSFIGKFFEQGTISPTIIGLDDSVEDADVQRIENWFKRTVTGVKNAFGAVAIRGSIKPALLSQNDLEKLSLKTLTDEKREDIATALGVPQTLLFSNAANYACISGTQLVYTPNGAIPIVDLSAGDTIYQYDDTGIVTNVVVAITPQGEAPVYEVRTQNKRLEASDNHLFLVLKVNKGTGNGLGNTIKQSHEFIWKRTDELTTNDILVTVEEFPDQNIEEHNGIPLTIGLSRIISIDYLGYKEVYDLSTTGSHTFIAEGIIVHNTANQDAFNWYEMTIVPEARRIERRLNEQLFSPLGVSIRFRPEMLELYQEREADKASKMVQFYDRAIVSKNEVRRQAGWLPIDNGDEIPDTNQSPVNVTVNRSIEDLKLYRKKVLNRFKLGKSLDFDFNSDYLNDRLLTTIREKINSCASADEINNLFKDIESHASSL